MYESILEKLIPGRFGPEGTFDYKGGPVSLTLDPDNGPIEATLALAKRFLADLETYDLAAQQRVLTDFFSTYNECWTSDTNPDLSREAFLANLRLTAINFLSDRSVDFFYSGGGMFGHHSLIAQALNGNTFERSQMFG